MGGEQDRNRAKREVLPAIELAAKAGFEADDNTLSTLQSFNKGTFNVQPELTLRALVWIAPPPPRRPFAHLAMRR